MGREELMDKEILVVNTDPRERAMLAEGLDRRGFAVAQASSAADAVNQLSRKAPSLIVADADAGADLVGKLRRSAQGVPVFLLARDGSMASARRQGADEVLQKPIHVADLAVLAQIATAPNPRSFTGTLSELRVPHLLRALTSGGRSGRVSAGDGAGRILFREGHIVDAFYRHLRGEPALLRMLTLTAGAFEVEFLPVHRRGSIEFGLREVLTRGFPYVRRWEQIVTSTYPLTARLEVDFAALTRTLTDLPDEVNRVVRLFDGKRTLEQVVDASGFDDLTALEVVGKLDALGLLRRVDATDGAGPFFAANDASVPAGEALLTELFGEDRPAEGPLPGEALDWFAEYVKGKGSWEDILPGEDTGGWVEMPAQKAVGAALLAEAIDAALGEVNGSGKGPTWFEPPKPIQAAPDAPAPIELTQASPVALTEPVMHRAPIALTRAEEVPEPIALTRPAAPRQIPAPHQAEPIDLVPVQGAVPLSILVGSMEPPLDSTPRIGVELPPGLNDPLPSSSVDLDPVQLEWSQVDVGRFDATEPQDLPQDLPGPVLELLPSDVAGSPGNPLPLEVSPLPMDPDGEAAIPLEEEPPRRRRGPWLAAGAIAVLLGAAVALFAARRPAPLPPPPQVAEAPEPPPPPAVEEPGPMALENDPQVLRVERARALVLTAEAQKLYEEERLDEAGARAEDAISLDPTSVPAALLLGIVSVDSGQASRAVEVLERARSQEPANGRAAVLLGFAYQTLGNQEKAIQEYEDYLKIAPDGEQASDVKRVLARFK